MREYTFDTVIVGTGCAGYNCADWLYTLGRRDLAIVTRGRLSGASRNTGSDKQTYYKLSLASGMPDSVRKMARDLCAGGGVNAGVALAEAAGSIRSFMKLVNLGVPFPCNEYGEFVGYQTDHDHSGRATSAGPYTSKYMTEALERAVLEKGIPILEGLTAFHPFTLHGRVTGLACIDEAGESEAAGLVIFHCNQLVIATGGEAAAYWDSVYPESQTGALGMLVRAGVRLVNLNHWQYGLASTKFRWNVSGSYQQALPRYVSVGADGFSTNFSQKRFQTRQKCSAESFSRATNGLLTHRRRRAPLKSTCSSSRNALGEVLRNIPHMLASDGTFASLIETIDILTAQEAVLFAMETAGEAMGSYGGALYLDASGNVLPENLAHSQDRLITQDHICRLQKPLPIPEADIWFETVWAQYRKEHPQQSHPELR